jgi:hypothetical protein
MVVLAAATALSCAGLMASAASAAASAPAASARVGWGRAEEVPGLAKLNAGGNAGVGPVSCWRAGYCAAAGSYTDVAGHSQGFVVDENHGVWGRAEEVPGLGKLNAGGGAGVMTLSCGRAGGCSAGGYYHDSKGNQQAFVVSQAKGHWQAAEEVPGSGKLNVGGLARVGTISCSSAGNCAAGGYYQTFNPPGTGYNSFQAFVVSERGGRWAKAEPVPGINKINPPPYENGGTLSVACASAGNCAAGGYWWGIPCAPGTAVCPRGFVANELKGRWDELTQPRNGGPIRAIACWRAGDCMAVGSTDTNGDTNPIDYIPFAETETNGHWGKAKVFTSVTGGVIKTLSCPSANYCAMAGTFGYDESGDPEGAMVLRELDGHWSKALELTGPAGPSAGHPGGPVGTISCATARNCGAGGSDVTGLDTNGNFLYGAYVAGERNGRWAPSEVPPGLAALALGGTSGTGSVSCASASACSAGGSYTDAAGHTQGWVDGSR